MSKLLIDGNRLRNVVTRKGKTLSEVSESLGYCNSTLSKAIRDGEIEERLALLLESIGIKREEYIETPRIEPRADRETSFYDSLTESEKRLYKVINKAVYDAFAGIVKKYGTL